MFFNLTYSHYRGRAASLVVVFTLTLLFFVVAPMIVSAQSTVNLNNLGNNPALDVSIANPFFVNGNPVTTVEGVILAILQLLIVIVTPLIALAIILGGLKYVTARGNPQQISEAHKMITYAIIGAVLVLGAITLSEVLNSTISAFRTKS